MKFTIHTDNLSNFVKQPDGRACLGGQILQQMQPEKYADAPTMVGMTDARDAGLISQEEKERLDNIYDYSIDLRFERKMTPKIEAYLKSVFPNDEFEIVP